jgi:large subunit ribosomal protein L16
MLMPKRVKYRKHQRGKRRGLAYRGSTLSFGDFGLQCLECGWLFGRQIEAARKTISHSIKRGGKLWIRVFPDHSVTMRAAETRMGSGKGNPEHWVAVVRPGTILFELSGISEEFAREAMRLAAHKIPMKTRLIKKKNW